MSKTSIAKADIANSREVAASVPSDRGAAIRLRPAQKVWIDLENSPHVPFFRPIIEELEKRGCTIVVTARDCFQVCELADMAGLKYRKIGHHYGKHRLAKLVGLAIRVLQLAPLILRERPAISVSHGSRSLVVLSALLRIKCVTIVDYEFADHRLSSLLGSPQNKWIMTPEVIPSDAFEEHGMLREHVLHYPGIKEDVYVPFFQPNASLKSLLGLESAEVVVTIRPPATEAHYHNPESEKLLLAVFDLLSVHPGVKAVLLPRTHRQEGELRHARPDLFVSKKIIVPKHAVDGLDLIWLSDLVISGGGTMNREAAAMGVPVYSLFRGTIGAVDRHLGNAGRLVLLESAQDVHDKVKLVPRDRILPFESSQRATLDVIVNHISEVIEN